MHVLSLSKAELRAALTTAGAWLGNRTELQEETADSKKLASTVQAEQIAAYENAVEDAQLQKRKQQEQLVNASKTAAAGAAMPEVP